MPQYMHGVVGLARAAKLFSHPGEPVFTAVDYEEIGAIEILSRLDQCFMALDARVDEDGLSCGITLRARRSQRTGYGGTGGRRLGLVLIATL